jgi:hypothetical protein
MRRLLGVLVAVFVVVAGSAVPALACGTPPVTVKHHAAAGVRQSVRQTVKQKQSNTQVVVVKGGSCCCSGPQVGVLDGAKVLNGTKVLDGAAVGNVAENTADVGGVGGGAVSHLLNRPLDGWLDRSLNTQIHPVTSADLSQSVP